MRIRGQLFLLKIGDGGDPEVWTTVAGQRTGSKSIGNDQIDVTDKEGSRWRKLLEGGGRNLTITARGLITDADSYRLLNALSSEGAVRNFRLYFANDYFLEGPFLVEKWGGEGEYQDAKQYELTLVGADDPTFDFGEDFALLLTEGGDPVLLVENGEPVLVVEIGYPGISKTGRELVNDPSPALDSVMFLYGDSGEPFAVQLTEFVQSFDYQPRQVTLFTASGMFTKPAGARLITVECVGGGGGGAGGQRPSLGSGGGGGGGGGGYAIATLDADDVPDSVTVTVGLGGVGGSPLSNNATNGGTTSFGALLAAYGGGAGGRGFATSGGAGGGGAGSYEAGAVTADGGTGGVGGKFGGGAGANAVNGGTGGLPGGDALLPGGGAGGGSSNNNDGTATGGNGGRAVSGGQGGGAGGGVSADPAFPGASGAIWNTTALVAGGAAASNASSLYPVFASSMFGAGGGGGGGAYKSPAVGGNGGRGQQPGGGGGGGGNTQASSSPFAEPGAGGAGGDGAARITVEF